MKRGAIVVALALAVAFALGGCAGGNGAAGARGAAAVPAASAAQGLAEAFEADDETTGVEEEMMDDEAAVLAAWEAMQQAMVDKNVDAMLALTTEDKTFTHMSGKVQTREEFFGEIADGTLNYFGYEVHDPHVTIDGDYANLTGSTTLNARVYGMSGSWTLPTNAHFVRMDGKWIQCN